MKLLKYVKEYRFPAIIGFVFKIAEAALELMVPLVMADIIDVGIKNNDQNYILVRGLFLVGLAVAGYLFALVCQYYASLTSQSVGTKLREDMYHQINRYDHHNLDKLSAPTLVTRLINDVVQIQLAVAMTIRLTSRAPFIMIGSLFLAFLISGPLASIFVVGAIVLAIVMLMITIISMPYFNNVQKKLDKISLIVRENLNGIRVIRAFASQDKEINKFKTETRQQKDIQVKVGRIQALLNPFTYLIVNVAIVLIVYFGGTEVNVGGLSQGEVIALVNYMNSILLALIVFANVLSIYNKAGASYTRIFEVLETEPAVVNDGQIQIYRESEDCIEFSRAVAQSALPVTLYNPAGRKRRHLLTEALDIFREQRGGDVLCAYVRHAGRPQEAKWIGRLDDFPADEVDMSTLVIIGGPRTITDAGAMYE